MIDRVSFIDTLEPEKAMVLERDGSVFRMNSAMKPTTEADRWAARFEKSSVKRVACMFGLGTGLFADRMLEKLSEDSTLIVCEPSVEVEEYTKEMTEEVRRDKRMIVISFENDPLAFKEALIKYVDFYMLEGLIVCAHPQYDKVFPEQYGKFIHAVNEARERVLVNKNTLARFKDTASKNIIRNLPMLKEINLVSELSRILPREVPVIIVSAGPSLDKNIELLKRAKGHCLIFAVDTAMKYLMQRDIMPDLGITVEPIKPMANYEDERCFTVPHIFDSESNADIVEKHTARKFLCNCRDYVRRLLESLGKEIPNDGASGGSVATAAFAMCYSLNMKNIILIGQDLAYEGEATHAGGVESKGINNNIGYTMVEGVNGEPVRTRSDWIGYLRWFENAIAVIEDIKKDITVTDATEGGALIHGTVVRTLADVIEESCVKADGTVMCDYDFEKELEKLPYFVSESEYPLLTEKIKTSFEELSVIKEKSREASKCCERIISGEGTDRDIAQINDTRTYCESTLLYPMINNYAVSEIADEVNRLKHDPDDRHSAAKQQKLAFDAICAACDSIREIKDNWVKGN